MDTEKAKRALRAIVALREAMAEAEAATADLDEAEVAEVTAAADTELPETDPEAAEEIEEAAEHLDDAADDLTAAADRAAEILAELEADVEEEIEDRPAPPVADVSTTTDIIPPTQEPPRAGHFWFKKLRIGAE